MDHLHIKYNDFSRTFLKKLSSNVSQYQCVFDLVWFYGISTIVGYLMPNPFYTYILNGF